MLRKLAFILAATFALPALAGSPVDINKADAAELAQSLNGIGLAKARAIVAWREENGPFRSADDLASVKGIGTAMVEKNREFVVIEPSKPIRKKAEDRPN
jgi:competence protein ComEA